jgi:FixJ family two-component response regulator
MPGMNGIELLRILVVRRSLLPVLLLTASHDEHVRHEAMGLGAVDCLTKPVPESVLLGAIEGIRETRQAQTL